MPLVSNAVIQKALIHPKLTTATSPLSLPSNLSGVSNTSHKLSTAKCKLLLKRGAAGLKFFALKFLKSTPIGAPFDGINEARRNRKVFRASRHTLIQHAQAIVTELQKYKEKINPDFSQQVAQLMSLLAQLEKSKSSVKELKELDRHFAHLLDTVALDLLPLPLRLQIVRYQHDWQMLHVDKIEDRLLPLKAVNAMVDGVDKAGVLGLQIPAKFLTASLKHVFSIAGSIVSLPGAISLIVTSAADLWVSKRKNEPLHSDKEKLRQFATNKPIGNSSLSRATQTLDQLLSRKIRQNRHLIAKNVMNIVSGATSLSSGILAFTPAQIASLPLTIVGAVVNSIANLYQDRVLKWQNQLVGKGASESAKRQADEFFQLLSSGTDIEGITQNYADCMNDFQQKVAESKLHSLIQSVLKDARKNKIKHDAHSLYTEVERRANKLVGRLINGTSLLKSDLDKLRAMLQESYLPAFFDGGLAQVQANLNERVLQNLTDLKLEPSEETLEKIHKKAMEKFLVLRDKDAVLKKALMTAEGKRKKSLTADELKQLCDASPRAQAIVNAIEMRYLIQQIKVDSKFLRHEIALQFMVATQANLAQQQAAAPNKIL